MNGRRLYREYAQGKGKEAKEFVEIKSEQYSNDTLVTKDNSGNREQTPLDYRDVVNWIIKNR